MCSVEGYETWRGYVGWWLVVGGWWLVNHSWIVNIMYRPVIDNVRHFRVISWLNVFMSA